jgi:diguanylate cyclase (GGDEF)-like protein
MHEANHPALELDHDAIALRVEVERVRVFNERSITGALSSPVAIALLGWVLTTQVDWTRGLVWVALITVAELAILYVGLRCRRALAAGSDGRSWLEAHIVLAGICGAVWGTAVWFSWKTGGFIPYLATITILMGVAGVSMVTVCTYTTATILFFGGIYLVPLLHEIVYPKPPATGYIEIGLMIIFAVQVWYARGLKKVVTRELEHFARNHALVERLHALVTHDQLTGAYSRRYILERVEQQVAIRQRHGTPASIIMFDLDNFKAINDHYGHPAGDRALQEVVRAVNAQLRDGDMLARVGGEEFLVLLPMTGTQAAHGLAERLRQTLEATHIVEGTKKIYLPASFGVAEMQPKESFAEWFGRVDAALYQAKDQGRNSLFNAD